MPGMSVKTSVNISQEYVCVWTEVVVVLPWFTCDEFSRAHWSCQFYWTFLLLSVRTCLHQDYYWVTQVSSLHPAGQSEAVKESLPENSKQFWSPSLLHIPPDQWEKVRCHDAIIYFDPNWALTWWGWLCTVQLGYRPINKMYRQDSINSIKTQLYFTAHIALRTVIWSENQFSGVGWWWCMPYWFQSQESRKLLADLWSECY